MQAEDRTGGGRKGERMVSVNSAVHVFYKNNRAVEGVYEHPSFDPYSPYTFVGEDVRFIFEIFTEDH